MPRLKIDGREVDAAENATVLEAAREAGVAIPTLCHHPETGALTSCMICVVRNAAAGKTLLACASAAEEGMDIVTNDDEICALRRDTLALLLAEHAGDCEGPCERACPAGLRVPQMLRRLQQGEGADAATIAREDLIFPGILGSICTAPCQKICRRGQYDQALAIRACHGGAAETFPEKLEQPQPASGKSVAIIGAGLAGLAAARVLAQHGHACRLYEREDRVCPGLDDSIPDAIREAEFAFLKIWNVATFLATDVDMNESGQSESVMTLATCLEENDAVILAIKDAETPNHERIIGAREETMPVRAVAAGKRAAWRVQALFAGEEYQEKRMFNSRLGRLEENDLEAYAVERKERCHECEGQHALFMVSRAGMNAAPDGNASELSCAAQKEAARCLHCDCLQPTTCKLRLYAEEYGVTLGGKRNLPHRIILPIERAGAILFEPGKCIKCGVCIALTRKYGIDPGMTIAGRGVKSRVRAALGATLQAGLGSVAEACVRACPTAALAFENESHCEQP